MPTSPRKPQTFFFPLACALAPLAACAGSPETAIAFEDSTQADALPPLYCGEVTAIGIEDDIWTNFRLEIRNLRPSESTPWRCELSS